MAHPKEYVVFNAEQVEFLDKCFPEVTNGSTLTDAQLRERVGQRSVVQTVRARMRRFGSDIHE